MWEILEYKALLSFSCGIYNTHLFKKLLNLSLEPLLGPLEKLNLQNIDWESLAENAGISLDLCN